MKTKRAASSRCCTFCLCVLFSLLNNEFVASCCLETHVESFHTVGQCSEGDEVHACLGIRNHGVEGDAARGFCFGTACHELHGLGSVFGREVVEHDAVATFGKGLFQLFPVAHFTLYLEVLAMLLAVLLGA